MATATASMTLAPLGDRVVVKQVGAETKTASGLVLPDSAQEKPILGKVIATGPGRMTDEGKRIPMDVKEGDTVVYAKYGGTELKLDGEEYMILQERDILAIKR